MVVRTSPRELKKAEKRERIRLAALGLFAQLGYEATTMRDVARRAKVGLGTLSLYAKDKRDLILLVFNDLIGDLTTEAIEAAWRDRNADLSKKLLAFFGTYYTEWHRNPTLARVFLQLNYYSSGMHGETYQATRIRVARAIEAMVQHAISVGEISKGEETDLIARHFFYVFSAAARWWIAEDSPDPKEGLGELSRLLNIQIAGLKQPLVDNSASRRRNNVHRNLRTKSSDGQHKLQNIKGTKLI